MPKFTQSPAYTRVTDWLATKNQAPFDFQRRTWEKFSRGYSGLVVAPTGYGKTFSVFLAVVITALNAPDTPDKRAKSTKLSKQNQHNQQNKPKTQASGLKLLWVSPLRSLAADLQRAMQTAADELALGWTVEVRNGDTPTKDRQRQFRQMPEVLIITPESLHLLLAQKRHARHFTGLLAVAVDEWHDLLGNKRGVMTELALSRLRGYQPTLQTWGITATIGNIEQAREVLIPGVARAVTITTRLRKQTDIIPVIPEDANELPWAGHLGKRMVSQVLPIIHAAQTALIFTNTRNQSEQWYQLILDAAPEYAGQIAIHHGSIDKQLRHWIEQSISTGQLKAVICTSSLDLGVDFKPVDVVIQIGSPKGIARFLQRAGRSGHAPDERSRIYGVPTHSLELMEVAALQSAVRERSVESRLPMTRCYDVLVQYLVTLAVGEGFLAPDLYREIRRTHAYRELTEAEWQWALRFITQGGEALNGYEQYHKVVVDAHGIHRVTARRIAMLHRLNLGAIVSDAMMRVKFTSGGYIGMVEEVFISKLEPGDKFILAGRVLELRRIKEMTAYVRSASGKAIAPSWVGGRLPLTSHLSHYLRAQVDALATGRLRGQPELKALQPLMDIQAQHSHVPRVNELLIETIKTREGYHLFVYPFEGRLVHEVMAAVIGYRLSQLTPLSLTMAMNDYGFELLSDQPLPLTSDNADAIFSPDQLMRDVAESMNATEMAQRKFRDIAVIAGLVVQNYPGQHKGFKGLQASSGLIFNVLSDFEPDHPLLKQAYDEVFDQQMEAPRLQAAFARIDQARKVLTESRVFTPLSFPIKVDSLRVSMSNEDLLKRIERMQQAAERATRSRKKPRPIKTANTVHTPKVSKNSNQTSNTNKTSKINKINNRLGAPNDAS